MQLQATSLPEKANAGEILELYAAYYGDRAAVRRDGRAGRPRRQARPSGRADVNSAIDELIPARMRGIVDLLVNGSYWLGTAAGAAATLVLLNPSLLALDLGWRVCFFMGADLRASRYSW